MRMATFVEDRADNVKLTDVLMKSNATRRMTGSENDKASNDSQNCTARRTSAVHEAGILCWHRQETHRTGETINRGKP